MAVILPLLIALAVLMLLSVLFSMSEAAFLAVNKVRLRHLMQRGSIAAKLVYQQLTQLDRLITAILVGSNVVSVSLSVLATLACIRFFGEQRGPVIATVVVTMLLLVVGEITPKIFAAAHADRVALVLVWPLRAIIKLLQPLSWLFTILSHAIIRLLGGGRMGRSPLVTEEEIKVMIEMGREAGVLAEGELRMLHRIFEFSDSVVHQVMIPREEIAAVDLTAKPEQVLDVLIEEGHSRIPIYRKTLDDIVGVIYAKDLLAMVRHTQLIVLADLIHPVMFVHEHKRVAELLSDFQRERIQIAIVRDAHSRTVGLLTIEDLLEEIVGEISEDGSRRPGGWLRGR